MAKLKQGILGGISGKVGTVIGGSWRGIEYIRGLSRRRSSTSTPAQAEQQAKFALASKFLQSMRDLLTVGFRDFAIRMTGSNHALSYTLKNAIIGVFPNYSIDFSEVLISRGSLPNGTTPAAVPGAAGVIRFNWVDNTGQGKAKANDKVLMVAYCADLEQTVYIMAGVRSAGTANLSVAGFSGKPVQTWITFISEDKKDISSSIFTGQVAVA